MQVRIEDVSPVEKKLMVEVPWATVSDKLASAYRELSKTVNIRGFRKGKVPRSVLQQMYGKHVRTEVAHQLVRESFLQAASQHNLTPVSEPRVEHEIDIKSGQPLSFEAFIEVKGDVIVQDHEGMELRKRRVDVSEEAVDQALDALRRQHTELLPLEGRDITAPTDVVAVKITGSVGDQPIDEPQALIDLGDPEREALPGLNQALTGLPINTTDHDIELTIPADHSEPAIAGATAQLRISILDVRQKEVPELDDEFARDLDRGETVAELRQSVRNELEERQREEIHRELREAALKELVKRNQIPLASTLVERGIEFQYQQMRAMLGMWGMGDEGPGLTDDMRERLRPSAMDAVRGELLIETLAATEQTEISEDAVQQRVARLAASRGVPAARLRAELERDGELDNIRYQLRRDKILDTLIERAMVTEVDAAELKASQPDQGEPESSSEPVQDESSAGEG